MKLLLITLSLFSLLQADTITIEEASTRITFENIKLSDDEDMGLVGLNYLLEPNNNFYYGLGVYGAVSGDRGGFFVGGFTAGLKYEIFKNLYIDSGVFAGGGGGASAGQGGGLMLKAYMGALYRFDEYSLGVNYSHVRFPNGEIKGNQLAFVADMKFDTVFASPKVDADDFGRYHFTSLNDYVVATYQVYEPVSNTKTRSGAPLTQAVKLMGVEYGANLSENIIVYLESAGAMGGESTGYMEVLGGVGYTTKITQNSNLQAKLSLGAAGGGEIDTAGGGITKAHLNFNYNLAKDINLGLGAGYFHALEGGFDAPFAKVNVGINSNFLSLGSSNKKMIDFESITTQKFTIRVVNQTYLYSNTLSTNPQNKENVQLVGMKIDWFMSENLYLSGQAFGAYKGGAGGYAAGMFALGYVQPLIYDFSAVAEVGLGAGGGGSINTGGGNIIQPMIGIMYNITEDVAFETMYGRIQALNGDLEADVLDFSLVYRFNKLRVK